MIQVEEELKLRDLILQLHREGRTNGAIAKKIGKSEPYVAQRASFWRRADRSFHKLVEEGMAGFNTALHIWLDITRVFGHGDESVRVQRAVAASMEKAHTGTGERGKIQLSIVKRAGRSAVSAAVRGRRRSKELRL